MSYEPTTWVTGDIITATKLNNIESGVQSVSSSYTPTTWVTGDIITATKLNNIEQGIANAGGSSSDFSTAKVVVINDSSDGVTMTGAFFEEGYGVYGQEVSEPGTQEKSLIVYENASSELHFNLGTTTITTITGAATKSGNDYVDVTGDCTITIS